MKYLFKAFFLTSIFLLSISCDDEKLIATYEEPYQSDGNIWEARTIWPDTGNSHHLVSLQDLVVNSSNEIFVATDFAGVFKTSNQGISWKIINSGLISTVTGSDTNYYVSALTSLNEIIFCGNTNLSNNGGIYLLNQSEENWTPLKIFNDYSVVIDLERNDSGELFAGCYYGLFLSKDNGNTWNDIDYNLNWDSLAYVYTIAFDSKENIYIGTRNGIYVSHNNGDSWINLGLSSKTIYSIAINSRDEIFVCLVEENKIMYSNDNGANWKEILNLPEIKIRQIIINLNDIIFLSTWNGIYRSMDDGLTFQQIALQNIAIEKIVIDSNGHLIAGSYRKGIFISKE